MLEKIWCAQELLKVPRAHRIYHNFPNHLGVEVDKSQKNSIEDLQIKTHNLM